MISLLGLLCVVLGFVIAIEFGKKWYWGFVFSICAVIWLLLWGGIIYFFTTFLP